MAKLNFLSYKATNPLQPLFIYLPGMDGSGRLLHKQTKLWQLFNVRCLSIASEYLRDWDNLTDRVIALIERELTNNSQRSIYLCGESFGGCLAMKLMAKIPQLLTQVILVNPASSFYQRPWLSLGAYVTQVIPQQIYAGLTLLLLPFMAKWEAVHPRERRALLSAMQSLPPQIVSERIELVKSFQVEIDPLKSFARPVLIVASGEDQLLPSVEEAQRLKQLFSNIKISILPDSGHCCLLEKNVDLAQIVRQSFELKT